MKGLKEKHQPQPKGNIVIYSVKGLKENPNLALTLAPPLIFALSAASENRKVELCSISQPTVAANKYQLINTFLK